MYFTLYYVYILKGADIMQSEDVLSEVNGGI